MREIVRADAEIGGSEAVKGGGRRVQMEVGDYIREKLPKTVRRNEKDADTLLGLPYPYTVPCAETHFNELYYWDTYFTNKALFALGNAEQAKNNVRDILHLIPFSSNLKIRVLFGID